MNQQLWENIYKYYFFSLEYKMLLMLTFGCTMIGRTLQIKWITFNESEYINNFSDCFYQLHDQFT